MVLVGVHRGPLGPRSRPTAQRLFDRRMFVYRPPVPGIHYMAPLRVAAVLRALRIDEEAAPVIHHFHAGPYTPWVYRLPRRPRPGKWFASFHGSRGSFGEAHCTWPARSGDGCTWRALPPCSGEVSP